MKEIFEYNSYKKFLNDWLSSRPQQGRGWKTKLAEAIGTQGGFITQVLSGSAHLSLEQGMAAGELLAQTAEGRAFFMLLIQYERAGTKDLRKFFETQIERVREDRRELSKRLQLKNIPTDIDQAMYFQTWLPACVHVMLLGEHWKTPEAIAEHLRIPIVQVVSTIEFLVKSGLVEPSGKGYRTGPVGMHLGKQSPHLLRHHLNWNFKAMQALEEDHKKDLHYSSVMTISEEDAKRIQEILTEALARANAIIEHSPAEKVFAATVNLFEL